MLAGPRGTGVICPGGRGRFCWLGVRVALSIAVGTRSLDVVPFERFDDFRGFSAHWAARLVPGPAVLNHWDHGARAWRAPPLEGPITLRPAVQCLVSDGFGVRDGAAERAMMARICDGLGVSGAALHAAVEAELPPARFAVDSHAALNAEQRAAGSWEVLGQAHFEHLVLRGAVGRLGDWILVSVAVDFTLSARTVARALRGPDGPGGALTERRPDDLRARSGEAERHAGSRAGR